MLYQPSETEVSESYLERVFTQIRGDVCLLGGWATHQIVNSSFADSTGRSYIGSRDIDIGFHIDKSWSEEQLRNSEYAAALSAVKGMGFRPISFRLAKDFDSETGRELTPEEAAKLQLYQIFQLYVDPIVDYIHPKMKRVLGFVPIDEPLLSLVFEDGLCTTENLFGTRVMIPKSHVLLAMKLNSVVNRDKEHKRIKDIADIYALLWFSEMNIDELRAELLSAYGEEKAKKTVRSFTMEEIDKVSAAIGVDAREIRRVLAEIS